MKPGAGLFIRQTSRPQCSSREETASSASGAVKSFFTSSTQGTMWGGL